MDTVWNRTDTKMCPSPIERANVFKGTVQIEATYTTVCYLQQRLTTAAVYKTVVGKIMILVNHIVNLFECQQPRLKTDSENM